MTIYADSSFFVSLHMIDRYSPGAWRRMTVRPSVWLNPLNRAEFVHAVFQHVFWRKATVTEAENAIANLDRDCLAGVWQQVAFPELAFDRSIDLARRHGPSFGVRTLDSLHVACALELKADRFWTFDERQAKLAEAVGLNTDE